jgi:hypothetical protein
MFRDPGDQHGAERQEADDQGSWHAAGEHYHDHEGKKSHGEWPQRGHGHER